MLTVFLELVELSFFPPISRYNLRDTLSWSVMFLHLLPVCATVPFPVQQCNHLHSNYHQLLFQLHHK